MKTCAKCGKKRRNNSFYVVWTRGWSRKLSSYCKECYHDRYISAKIKENNDAKEENIKQIGTPI